MAGQAKMMPKKQQKAAAHHTEEEIRQLAHQIYLQRGGEGGTELQDWLEAEAQLRQKDSEQS